MAGMTVVVTGRDAHRASRHGRPEASGEKHSDTWFCVMITYPSTHGVFEDACKELCQAAFCMAGGCMSMAPT
jgi:glycine dehydrogenase